MHCLANYFVDIIAFRLQASDRHHKHFAHCTWPDYWFTNQTIRRVRCEMSFCCLMSRKLQNYMLSWQVFWLIPLINLPSHPLGSGFSCSHPTDDYDWWVMAGITAAGLSGILTRFPFHRTHRCAEPKRASKVNKVSLTAKVFYQIWWRNGILYDKLIE